VSKDVALAEGALSVCLRLCAARVADDEVRAAVRSVGGYAVQRRLKPVRHTNYASHL
jgi:hypothetical protein